MASTLYSSTDHASFSNSDAALPVHLALDWSIDFDHKLITGTAKYSIEILKTFTSHMAFDTSALDIKRVIVTHGTFSTPVEFIMHAATASFGSKLSVAVPEELQARGSKFEVTFSYSTSSSASAVQWLSPAATAGGQHPYVFTQCQAIHARSLVPCMDTPAVKLPYTAVVRVPDWCTVLMSAIRDSSESEPGVFKFTQPVATSTYLIALAAGQLSSAVISPRVSVWAEPQVIAAAQYEFSQTEEFLSAAESLAGPYLWGRYDILCLPPSFPYGGMENPCLTFATPTLLAGDRSLADVIAHEIAHSWTGNLVTNSTWAHFWLNEGWTVWLERKIMARVHGDSGLEHLKLSAQIGYRALVDSVARLSDSPGGDTQGFTQLCIPYVDQDPDDAFSSVPYEKGFTFLYYLESIVGTDSFEAFFKAYVINFKFKTVTTGAFRDFFVQYFAPWTSEIVDAISRIDWDAWFLGRGMPPVTHDFSNSLSKEAKDLAEEWVSALRSGLVSPEDCKDVSTWSSAQTCVFLDTLLAATSKDSAQCVAISAETLRAMDDAYHFTATKNSEIKFRWLLLGLGAEAEWIVDPAVAFVTSQGRMKYVRPLYRAMRLSEVGAEAAVETFNKYQNMYHPIAKKMIGVDLNNIQSLADSQIA